VLSALLLHILQETRQHKANVTYRLNYAVVKHRYT